MGDFDRHADHELWRESEENEVQRPRISPGKTTLTSRLPVPSVTNVIFRVANVEAANAMMQALRLTQEKPSLDRDENGVAAGAEQAVNRAASSSGQPLPESVRKKFESSLETDLAGVRVHTGAESAAAAAAVGARAYTVGQDIHFADGEYGGTDPFSMHLLAHEVAHTVQQLGGTPRRQHKLAVSSPSDAAEVEADQAADAMVRGIPAPVGSARPTALSREPQKDVGGAPGVSQMISENDKGFMRSQLGLLSAAQSGITQLASGVQKFVTDAEGVFTAMEASLTATEKLYSEANAEVNTVLGLAKKAAAGRDAVVSALLDAAMAPISAKVGELVQNRFSAGNAAVKEALQSFPDDLALPGATTGSLMPDMGEYGGNTGKGKLQGWAEGKAKQGAKDAATGNSGTGASASSGPSKAAFWQSLAGHRKKISSVADMTASAAKAAGPIGQVMGAISSVISIGRSRADYSMDMMAADAQALSTAAVAFETGGATVAGMGQGLQGALTVMQTAAPDKKEVQKRIVMDILAKVGSDVELFTETRMQEWMKHRDFFTSLGIDIEKLDSYLNRDEEHLTRALARAQQMVTEKSGTSLVVCGHHELHNVEIPGLGTLPARLDFGEVKAVESARAVVTGAESAKQATVKDLEGITAAIDIRAKHLIKNGFVRVLLKSYEDVSPYQERGMKRIDGDPSKI